MDMWLSLILWLVLAAIFVAGPIIFLRRIFIRLGQTRRQQHKDRQ